MKYHKTQFSQLAVYPFGGMFMSRGCTQNSSCWSQLAWGPGLFPLTLLHWWHCWPWCWRCLPCWIGLFTLAVAGIVRGCCLTAGQERHYYCYLRHSKGKDREILFTTVLYNVAIIQSVLTVFACNLHKVGEVCHLRLPRCSGRVYNDWPCHTSPSLGTQPEEAAAPERSGADQSYREAREAERVGGALPDASRRRQEEETRGQDEAFQGKVNNKITNPQITEKEAFLSSSA